MPSMRVTIRQTPALLIVALAAACASRAAAHPDDGPSVDSWAGARERVELDTDAGVLRMRARGAK